MLIESIVKKAFGLNRHYVKMKSLSEVEHGTKITVLCQTSIKLSSNC